MLVFVQIGFFLDPHDLDLGDLARQTLDHVARLAGRRRIVGYHIGGDIDAVTAATISSRAVAEAVQNAYGAYQKLSSRGGHNE